MSRKAREDKSSWRVPSVHAFAGDYGPFKPPRSGAVEGALVLLTSTAAAKNRDGGSGNDARGHPLRECAAQAQTILLGGSGDGRRRFACMIVVDVAGMAGDDDDVGEMIRGEAESIELTKGFGKTVLRLLQRMTLRDASLVATGEMCPVLLKLRDALAAGDAGAVAETWLIHPVLPVEFINGVLVPMGRRRDGRSRKKGGGGGPRGQRVNLVFPDDRARDRRIDAIRHVFPSGDAAVVPARDGGVLHLVFGDGGDDGGDDRERPAYDPDLVDGVGRALFLSRLTVEMNRHTKQYELLCEDVTSDLAKEVELDEAGAGAGDVDWDRCERHVGALVLRGNRCVLVRSLSNQWKGMRLPSVVSKPSESAVDAAIRSVVEFTEVDGSEVMPLEMISPVTVYAPNGRHVVVQLWPLYAVAPPPDGPLEEADMEDEESPYDWYTFERSLHRLDERSIAGLRTMATSLIEAANVGILPCKWGGVFGQELNISSGVSDASPVGLGQLTAEVEQWQPSRQGDLLQEVRKANADILSRISADRKGNGPFKLPVTILSGFLGSGKTTLMTHILANYSDLKVAILVNDMSEVNIDAALLSKNSVSVTQRQEHMVEMSNGCICCTLREDLLVEVSKIASQGTFDYLIIESTGISEPMPVAETFTFEDSTGLRLGDVARIDTMVTVVDGSRFLSELDSIQSLREREWHADPEDRRTISHLLCDQVEFANVVVLNKCDLMSAREKDQVRRLVEQMNPAADVIESTFSVVPLSSVLGTGLFSMSEAETHDRWLKEARIGEHTPETLEYGISSFTYRARKPFFPRRLNEALQAMLDQTAPFDKSIVLRAKGFVWLATFPSVQGDFSLAGRHFSLVPGNPWWAEIDKEHWPDGLEGAMRPLWDDRFGDRQQEIVIIGEHLDRASIAAALDDCLLTDDDTEKGQDAWNQLCSDDGDDPFYDDWYSAIESMMQGGTEDQHNHEHEHHHH